ncbi:hypothetical protein JXO52_06610 [bacterium]|nr:hypothetical protein [bacterium]
MKSLRQQKGNIMVMAVAAITGVMIFSSLAVDIGCILAARNQLQSAVDASALAGAIGLIDSELDAQTRAVRVGHSNAYLKQPVDVRLDEITFPVSNRVRVETRRPVPLFFAPIAGVDSVEITTEAEAEVGTIIGTRGLRPWALPDMGWPTGDPVVVKSGSIGAPATNPSFFYPVDFPPVNRGNPVTGASIYEFNIANGSDAYVEIGDIIQVEPGNMTGPTVAGVQSLINLDPYAYWNGTTVVNSHYPGKSSPRIITIPLYDPALAPESGKKTIEVKGLAAFFLVGMQGNDVIGIYMERVSHGTVGTGYSFLKGVRLVK